MLGLAHTSFVFTMVRHVRITEWCHGCLGWVLAMCLVGYSELWWVVCLSVFNLLCCHLHLRVHDFLFYFEACPLHFLLLFSLPENFYLGLVNLSQPSVLKLERSSLSLEDDDMVCRHCQVSYASSLLQLFLFLSLMCVCVLDFFFFFFAFVRLNLSTWI